MYKADFTVRSQMPALDLFPCGKWLLMLLSETVLHWLVSRMSGST